MVTRLGLGASVSLELSPDAGEREQRPYAQRHASSATTTMTSG